MSSVTFKYGAMESSKSLQLLTTAYSYERQGKKVMCFKPFDERDGDEISTRAGFSRKADVVLYPNDNDIVNHVIQFGFMDLDCIFIDEAQFLTREQVISFTDVADRLGVRVIAYGLLVDFLGHQFEGTKAWIEYSDKSHEIESECFYCSNDATMNLRLLGNTPLFEGEQVVAGGTDEDSEQPSYKPVCRKCFKKAQKGIIQLPKK